MMPLGKVRSVRQFSDVAVVDQTIVIEVLLPFLRIYKRLTS